MKSGKLSSPQPNRIPTGSAANGIGSPESTVTRPVGFPGAFSSFLAEKPTPKSRLITESALSLSVRPPARSEMESLEALVAHIQALSGSSDEVSHLHSLLKQAEDSLQSQASRLPLFLEQMDPSKHSLGYLYFL